ncbi:MAG: hypothetical protein ACI9WU_003659 [Myxococcota bacterium]|jgi:hypothetical protein
MGQLLSGLLALGLCAAPADVPESAQFTLVHDLLIPEDGGYGDIVPWAIDNSAELGAFDRIAWYMELKRLGEPIEWVWVSARAFVHDPGRLGVPTVASGVHFQHGLVDMNVASNVPGKVAAGEGLSSGRIEFWPNNYEAANGASVSGASDTLYDTGDTPIEPVGGYGSMQVHDTQAGAVLFAYNRFGPAGSAEVGIGNNETGSPDWTFSQNAGEYEQRRLMVFVREVPTYAPPIPEAEGYTLAYQLDLPGMATAFHADGVPWALDDSDAVGTFNRVAYYLELANASGQSQWVWASFDAHTDSTDELGPLTADLNAAFQQEITGLEVASNVPGVPTGSKPFGGNIEMWPHNYGKTNAAAVPGASSETYDFGDAPAMATPAGYGSLQVHDTEAGVTLLAYNAWGNAAAVGDIGIGNAPAAEPDWTFANNAAGWDIKTLSVWVFEAPPPPLTVDEPVHRTLRQRDDDNQATIGVSGTVAASLDAVQARAVPRPGFEGTATPWAAVPISGGSYAASLVLSGGWYDVEIQGLSAGAVVHAAMVPRVGVGEIFVTAGQSNSANHGLPPQVATDERVLAQDLVSGWKPAGDPQPIATGSGGTPWPLLGDLLADEWEVPIGFVSVGWGGTSVAQWQPAAAEMLYPRLKDAVSTLGAFGFRAVLWHQGESDNASGTTAAAYQQGLETIIQASRDDAGFAVPWGVALASFLPATGSSPEIVGAQQAIADADPLVFVGAATDDLIGVAFRHDTIHFNGPGLQEHANRWAEVVLESIEEPESPPEPEPMPDMPVPTPDLPPLVEDPPVIAEEPVEVEPSPVEDEPSGAETTAEPPLPVVVETAIDLGPSGAEEFATPPRVTPFDGGCTASDSGAPSGYLGVLVLLLLLILRRQLLFSWQ